MNNKNSMLSFEYSEDFLDRFSPDFYNKFEKQYGEIAALHVLDTIDGFINSSDHESLSNTIDVLGSHEFYDSYEYFHAKNEHARDEFLENLEKEIAKLKNEKLNEIKNALHKSFEFFETAHKGYEFVENGVDFTKEIAPEAYEKAKIIFEKVKDIDLVNNVVRSALPFFGSVAYYSACSVGLAVQHMGPYGANIMGAAMATGHAVSVLSHPMAWLPSVGVHSAVALSGIGFVYSTWQLAKIAGHHFELDDRLAHIKKHPQKMPILDQFKDANPGNLSKDELDKWRKEQSIKQVEAVLNQQSPLTRITLRAQPIEKQIEFAQKYESIISQENNPAPLHRMQMGASIANDLLGNSLFKARFRGMVVKAFYIDEDLCRLATESLAHVGSAVLHANFKPDISADKRNLSQYSNDFKYVSHILSSAGRHFIEDAKEAVSSASSAVIETAKEIGDAISATTSALPPSLASAGPFDSSGLKDRLSSRLLERYPSNPDDHHETHGPRKGPRA